jgi:hypothetical protein
MFADPRSRVRFSGIGLAIAVVAALTFNPTAAAAQSPTIAATPTTVAPGGIITVTVTNAPGGFNDWVGLTEASAPDTAYVAWNYLSGGTTLQFVAPTTPGTYNARLFANGWTKLATSNPITVQTQTQPSLTIGIASVSEGNSGTTPVTFSVTLSPTSSSTVTVNYATANGTATAGSDYVAASGTLTFAPGIATRPVTVLVNGDSTPEPIENFVVTLSGPTNAILGSPTAMATIFNDDGTPTPTLTVPSSVAPGGVITVVVANATGSVSDWVGLVEASAPDGSYISFQYLNGLTSPPATGVTNATLQFVAPMTPGTYNLRLFNFGWTKLATSSPVTVQTQTQSSLTINSASVTEGNSGTAPATFTVTLSPASSQSVTVNYATANTTATAGSDYVAASGTLTFAPGITTQTVSVLVNGDTAVEPDETFVVTLSSPTNAVLGGTTQGVGTILNNDAAALPSLVIDSTTVTEGNGGTAPATFTVTLSSASSQSVTVAYATANITAAAGSDYVAASGTLTFAAGTTTRTVAVLVNGDTAVEPDEAFAVTLSSPTNAVLGGTQGVGTIVNDDAAQLPVLAINSLNVTEGNGGTTPATFTVTLSPASSQSVTVAYATANTTAAAGSDYVAASGTLTFAAGTTTRTVAVLVNGDTTVEPDEAFVINLSSPTNAVLGGTAQGVATIVNDDAPSGPTVTMMTPTVNSGGAITVAVANGPANTNDWIALARTTDPDSSYVAWQYLNGTTSLPTTGITNATLNFVAPVTPGTYNVRLFVNGWNKLATSGPATVQSMATLTISNPSVTEGNSGTIPATFTVTLTPTSTQSVTVAYATANSTAAAGSDYVAASGTLTFAPGVATRTVAVLVNGDATMEPDEAFVMTLSTPTNAVIGDSQGVATILNDDVPGVPTLTLSASTVSPGGTISVTVANGPGNANDWVALAATGSADSAYVAWQYLNGLASLPATGLTNATLQFVAPMTPGTYHARFFANGFTKLATSSTVTVTGDTTAPIITAVSAGTITMSGATITWTTNEASDSQVDYGPTTAYGSSSALNPSTMTSHSVVLSGMAANTLYHYRVRSRDAAGNLAVSGDFTFTTLGDTTAPVISAVAAASITGTGATINWTTNEASDTQVDYGLTTAYGSASVLNGTDVTTHTVSLSGLTVGTLYHYRARSRDAAGNLALSGDFTFTTLADTTAPVISAVAAVSITGSGATITWTTNEASDTQVNYGLTTAYGTSSTLNGTDVTAHTVSLSGLAGGTLYHYRARSRDAAGNLTLSGDFTFTTLGDVTDPTVVITAPVGGATVGGAVTVSATASDAVGVAGVQFRLDGVPLGAEDVTAPYSISWPTLGSTDLIFGVTKAAVLPMTMTAGSGFTKRLSVTCPGCGPEDMASEDRVQTASGPVAATWTFSVPARSLTQMAAFKATGTPAYVQGASATSQSPSTTVAQTFGANVTAGHLLVVAVAWQGNSTVSATDNRGNTYLVATSAYDTVNEQSLAILYAANAASGATTVTASFSGPTPTIQRLAIHAYSGMATTNPLDGTAENIADGTTTANNVTSGSAPTTVTPPVSNGSHTLTAVARDAAGNTATSAGVTVTVSNGDTTPPVISGVAAVSITSAGATITWTTNEASDSQVNYGLTTAYGSTSPLIGTNVTAHSVILGALAANATYHFRVRSEDAAGNLALSGDFVFTTLGGDVTVPVVSITAPAAGATVSGTINFSATASDNVGVTGVEFKRGGVNIAPEDTTAPYTVAWDTRLAAQGVHTLTAVAWDAAGNSATATRTVTVANPLGQVNLAWNANGETDLAGYKLYVGTSSGVYGAPVTLGNVITHTVTGLTPGNTYYFVVTAYDQGGAESAFSNQVSSVE